MVAFQRDWYTQVLKNVLLAGSGSTSGASSRLRPIAFHTALRPARHRVEAWQPSSTGEMEVQPPLASKVFRIKTAQVAPWRTPLGRNSVRLAALSARRPARSLDGQRDATRPCVAWNMRRMVRKGPGLGLAPGLGAVAELAQRGGSRN